MHSLWASRQVPVIEGGVDGPSTTSSRHDGWIRLAGVYKDNPLFEDFLAEMDEDFGQIPDLDIEDWTAAT